MSILIATRNILLCYLWKLFWEYEWYRACYFYNLHNYYIINVFLGNLLKKQYGAWAHYFSTCLVILLLVMGSLLMTMVVECYESWSRLWRWRTGVRHVSDTLRTHVGHAIESQTRWDTWDTLGHAVDTLRTCWGHIGGHSKDHFFKFFLFFTKIAY